MLNKILFFIFCCVMSSCAMRATDVSDTSMPTSSNTFGEVLESEIIFESDGSRACVYLYEKLDNEDPDPISCEYGHRSECCTWRETANQTTCEQEWCISWDSCVWTLKQQSCEEQDNEL